MTAFASYSTGTVAVAASATTIIGTGTIWSGVNVRPGDDILIAGHVVSVVDVVDTTHLTIDPWPYTTVTAGAAYKVYQTSPLRFAGGQAMADVSSLVAALNSMGPIFNVASTSTVPDPSLGSDGQYAYQVSTGSWWLKTLGVWVSAAQPGGFPASADISSVSLNTLITNGVYFTEASCTNTPVAATQYYVIVQKYPGGSGYVQQTAWDLTATGGIWIRNCVATVWSAWVRLADKGYVDTADSLKVAKAGDTTTGAIVVGGGSMSVTGSDAAFGAGGNRGFIDNGRMGSLNGGGAAIGLNIIVNNGSAINFTSGGVGTFVSTPFAPTPAILNNSTALATTLYVDRTTREKLSGTRNYFVDNTNGLDTNTGLSAGAGNAFKTIQKAFDTVAALDINIQSVLIRCATGTYAGAIISGPWLGSGTVTLQGDTTTPSNCILSGAIQVLNNGTLTATGFKSTSSGYGLFANLGGNIIFGVWDFGVCSNIHMNAQDGGKITNITTPYTISGNAPAHYGANGAGALTRVQAISITVNAGLTFATAFVLCRQTGVVACNGNTYSSTTVTCPRIYCDYNGVINIGGVSTTTYLPGSSTPSPTTGGQYA